MTTNGETTVVLTDDAKAIIGRAILGTAEAVTGELMQLMALVLLELATIPDPDKLHTKLQESTAELTKLVVSGIEGGLTVEQWKDMMTGIRDAKRAARAAAGPIPTQNAPGSGTLN